MRHLAGKYLLRSSVSPCPTLGSELSPTLARRPMRIVGRREVWQRKRLSTSFGGNSCLELEDGNCRLRARASREAAPLWDLLASVLLVYTAAGQPLTKTTGERSQVSADVYGQGWGGDRGLGARSSQRRLLLK